MSRDGRLRRVNAAAPAPSCGELRLVSVHCVLQSAAPVAASHERPVNQQLRNGAQPQNQNPESGHITRRRRAPRCTGTARRAFQQGGSWGTSPSQQVRRPLGPAGDVNAAMQASGSGAAAALRAAVALHLRSFPALSPPVAKQAALNIQVRRTCSFSCMQQLLPHIAGQCKTDPPKCVAWVCRQQGGGAPAAARHRPRCSGCPGAEWQQQRQRQRGVAIRNAGGSGGASFRAEATGAGASRHCPKLASGAQLTLCARDVACYSFTKRDRLACERCPQVLLWLQPMLCACKSHAAPYTLSYHLQTL